MAEVGVRPPPLGAYVHYPWCVRKCPYCDFNSHALRDDSDFGAYTAALIADAQFARERTGPRPLRSIFFGGGTPSLCPPAEIAKLLNHLQNQFGFHKSIEITLEANPGTVDEAHFRGFRAAGINRLSLGVQSFDNDALRALGRIHDAARAHAAITTARRAGFDNINIDLMHGLPGQTPQGALNDLKQAFSHEPQHLSWYELTIEPQTAFERHPPTLPDEDTLLAIDRSGSMALRAAGFRNYEISAWAQAGHRAQHNLNYWRYGDFIGIGAGAHAKWTTDTGVIRREVRQRAPGRYLRDAGSPGALTQDRRLDARDRAGEFLLNALRLREGVGVQLFTQRTGLPIEAIEPGLKEAQALGLLLPQTNRIRPSALGLKHLNRLLACFDQV